MESGEGQALMRISSITRDLRFRPPGERVAVGVADGLRTAATVGGLVAGTSMVAGSVLATVGANQVLVTLSLAGGLGLLALGGVLSVIGGLMRSVLKVSQWRRLSGARGAGSVSIRGRAVPLRTVRSPWGETAIAFRARFTREGGGSEVERAEPFLLDDGQGEPVLVRVEHLYLADALSNAMPGSPDLPFEALDLLPSGDAPTEHQQLLLCPGDPIDVSGWLSSEVDPGVSTHFRGVPLRRVLRGTPESPLVVRQVRER